MEDVASSSPQLLPYQILLRATGRDEAFLDRMAFANLGLIHHFWVALVFIYAESRLLLLLVVSNLLLCQGVVSAPLCQNPSGKCQMPLQNLFDTATTVANHNYRLAWEMFSEFISTVLLAWRRQWQPTPVLLPKESHGGRSLVGYSPWGCKESDTTERLHSISSQSNSHIRTWPLEKP